MRTFIVLEIENDSWKSETWKCQCILFFFFEKSKGKKKQTVKYIGSSNEQNLHNRQTYFEMVIRKMSQKFKFKSYVPQCTKNTHFVRKAPKFSMKYSVTAQFFPGINDTKNHHQYNFSLRHLEEIIRQVHFLEKMKIFKTSHRNFYMNVKLWNFYTKRFWRTLYK